MKEVWELAMSAQVLPLTILLIPVALYWALNVIGVVDLDFLDVDVDTDGAGKSTIEGDSNLFGNSINGMLRLVNATRVPLMVVLSILIILLWGLTMLGNHYFNPNANSLAAGIVTIAALVASIALSRWITKPLIPLFDALKGDFDNHLPVIGRSGIVRTAEVTEHFGQAEIHDKGTPLLLNVRTSAGEPPIRRGTSILVYRHDPESNIYLVRPLEDLPEIL